MNLRVIWTCFAFVPAALTAQTSQSHEKRASGPSLSETKAWIEGDFPGLARAFYSSERVTDGGKTWKSFAGKIENVKLDGCTLSYTDVYESWYTARNRLTVYSDSTLRRGQMIVPIASINPSSLQVKTWSGTDYDRPVKQVYVDIRNNAAQYSDDKGTEQRGFAEFFMNDDPAGERMMAALHHLLDLCGAKPSAF